VVPTLNAGPAWNDWLAAYARQTVKPDYPLLIDSSSRDGTVERAWAQGFASWLIPKSEFNHGGTRQLGVRFLPEADIVLFMTQDAVLADPKAIERLLSAFDDPTVGAAYGRQLPHPGSRPIGAHARLFNYPAESQVRRLTDRGQHGLKTAFISNSFAAYRRSALLAAGGFPLHTIMNEDTYVAGKMLLAGWKIAYRADAEVYHSHDYGYGEEFRRYFDIGVFHAGAPWLRRTFGAAEGEGKRYVLSELRYLGRRAPWLIPSALFRTGLKWLGYRLGSASQGSMPVFLKRRLSLHRAYWSRA
jgi:rhamnosyltransferase